MQRKEKKMLSVTSFELEKKKKKSQEEGKKRETNKHTHTHQIFISLNHVCCLLQMRRQGKKIYIFIITCKKFS